MSTELLLLTILAFSIGIGLSLWHTRRRMRAHLAERIAREVERELARRIMADLRGENPLPPRKDP
ncbi:MAG TPA: hypothetical protein VGE57_12190 [Solimonas sp.]